MSRVYSIGFDLGGDIGVSIVRTAPRKKPTLTSIELWKLDVVRVPMPGAIEFGGRDGAVRARIHDPQVWGAVRAVFRELVLTAFAKAHQQDDGHLVIAYEQVNFGKSIYWAQFYGGLVATLMSVVQSELSVVHRAKTTLIGVNVSRVKAQLTGDSGAPKDVVARALRPVLDRAPLHDISAFGPLRHNATDALAVAIAGLQIAEQTWNKQDEITNDVASR